MGILKQKDFNARIEAVREVVQRNRLDAVLAFSSESEPSQVRYFSDYWPSFETAAVLIPAKGEPALSATSPSRTSSPAAAERR